MASLETPLLSSQKDHQGPLGLYSYRTLYVAAITAFAAVCGVILIVSEPHQRFSELAQIKILPHILTHGQALWNVDAELQGDCKCDRPFDVKTRILKKEIVCHCPRSFIPSVPRFSPSAPPSPTSVTHKDGCKCVLGPDKLGRQGDFAGIVTCTCPIMEPLNTDEDFDTHPFKK